MRTPTPQGGRRMLGCVPTRTGEAAVGMPVRTAVTHHESDLLARTHFFSNTIRGAWCTAWAAAPPTRSAAALVR